LLERSKCAHVRLRVQGSNPSSGRIFCVY